VSVHDVLAFAVAEDLARQVRAGGHPWSALLGTSVQVTASRTWPLPDFVITDVPNHASPSLAAEFKPPDQSKREYLTGLGQATAYTRDFDYACIVMPDVADDNYAIGDHVSDILSQPVADSLPIALVTYDPGVLSPAHVVYTIRRDLTLRVTPPARRADVESSFWAKWRDMSPDEMARLLEYSYLEDRPGAVGTIRDRAFDRLWADMASGRTVHWGGQPRRLTNTPRLKTAWAKNYRNFLFHLGWTYPDGKLTQEGLTTFLLVRHYGPDSQPFRNHIARCLLLNGKHLVLINKVQDLQVAHRPPADEERWLYDLDRYLAAANLLVRNVARHRVAVRRVPRGSLKAEKTLWRNLGLIQLYGPHEGRAYHPGQGYAFAWQRITALIQ
jgi:hypothetical protein